MLAAAGALSEIVDRILDAKAEAETDADDPGGIQAKLRHDLRTPLNAIIGYSEMVLEDLDGSAGAEVLRPDLEQAARRGTASARPYRRDRGS